MNTKKEAKLKKKKVVITANAGEGAEKLICSYFACENLKWHSHSGKQFPK